MASPFKDLFSVEFYNLLSKNIKNIFPQFKDKSFINDIYIPAFEKMELKERMRHTTLVLHNYMPESYIETIDLFMQLIDLLISQHNKEDNLLGFMFLPDYVEIFGIDDYETSVKAFEKITQFISCEFAVRPFIIKYEDRMIKQMIEWSLHNHPMVRRLASEGSRPRLPWAMALPVFKKNPAPILPILENLKNDPNIWVRKSVANNLNDISKDNPDFVISLVKKWHGNNKHTDAIVKHACRGLLKQGHPEILGLYGLKSDSFTIKDLFITNKEIHMGESLTFSFTIENNQDSPQTARIEYFIYHMKANGQLTPKIFKISERILKPLEKIVINRAHPFKYITTRKFYSGEHRLSIVINGKETDSDSFTLAVNSN